MRNFSKPSSLTIRCPPEKGKWVKVFANGSRKEKRILISPYSTRCFDSLLNHLTDKLNPTFGAIRNIYTLEGEPVTKLDCLQNEKTYVATGVEKYRPGNAGGRRSIVGQSNSTSGRAPDGGDVENSKERLMNKPRRRSSKAPIDPTQQAKLQQILNHSTQNHVME